MHRSEVSFENKTIFISRKLNHLSPIYIELNSLGYEICDTSLIKFEQIRFTHTPPTQWIFFSSQNAIHYFFAQQPELNATLKFGVMSQVSADYLMEYHKKADFIGQGVDVTQIAKDFAKVVKDETVLFPQAIDSLQTIQKHLSFTNVCHNLFVYKTSLLKEFELPEACVLVFTSPSNVQAYFEKYHFLSGQKVVAIGSTTGDKLKECGIKDIAYAAEFNEIGLLKAIKEQLKSSVSKSQI